MLCNLFINLGCFSFLPTLTSGLRMSNPAAGRPYLTGISTLINLSTHRFPKRNHEPTVELDSSLGYQMYAHLNSLAPINNQSLTSIQ